MNETQPDNIHAVRTKAHRKMERHILTAVSVLANQTSRRVNALQAVVGYTLFAYKVPKRVVAHLHHLGLSVSYSSILVGVRSMSHHIRNNLRRICSSGESLAISFDNLMFAAPVVTQTIINQTSYLTHTTGYVLQLPEGRRRPMLTHADIRIAPSHKGDRMGHHPYHSGRHSHADIMERMIADLLNRFAADSGRRIQPFPTDMPTILQLDPKERPIITTLPTYKLNEGEISDIIDIHYRIRDDIGLSSEQVQENIVNFKGDLLTTVNNRLIARISSHADLYRRAVFRQSQCKPEERLRYVEATTGLFHTEMHALNMMFEAHLGKEGDIGSLSRWISEFGRDATTLWDGQRSNVKNFRASKSFWNIILDGHILASIADICGFKGVHDMSEDLDSIRRQTLEDAIVRLASEIGQFSTVAKERRKPDRDQIYENRLLFLQHGLFLRAFDLAMRQGDIGRVTMCLSYLAVWFQMTNKRNYAMEMVHLVICIRKIWSPDMVEFWRLTCLINLSGKPEGFIACDHLGEIVVGEVKSMMHHCINDATGDFLCNHISPSMMMFHQLKRKMTAETEAPTYGYKSARVNTMRDIRVAAERILDQGICRYRRDRGVVTDVEVVDLHGKGLIAIGSTAIIQKYIAKIESDRLCISGADADRSGQQTDVYSWAKMSHWSLVSVVMRTMNGSERRVSAILGENSEEADG